ncbi:flavin-containing monooxygenase [Mycobacterium branderi]|uniref:Cyclohexanone monooxygenase n=1 Tax=Mycobacterium branderi TaxID=43348 RepID=A0A7I7WEX5_9MYCO|nr:NAD(P)/FAD-dependent oxidoreductase [Mycobacterium branderi]MCV7231891.1 NAD(P)/FAD-dependent oxidoreductase [Mycobacterium branderi]ORA40435.1 cyclohexanone monooxygenase [Mycobacterium branderi]BBZ15452.1 cyclohexanone monooxygenase [Mycobacterium branderi]
MTHAVQGRSGNAVELFDVVIVGAGFSGLYMLYRARELGLRARVYEMAPEVGGVWFWNRYPGARCDSESMYYSYSFSEELEQEWPLKERYPSQPTNLAYLKHVADRFDLRKDIQFNTTIAGATWDDAAKNWCIRTEEGQSVTARYLVAAVGCLSTANKPKFDGMEEFGGEIYYTSEWPEDGVDLAGKRVGVIGTGSSGIQAIPEIAKQAAHLTVFQRTAQYTLPANNYALDPAMVRDLKANYREIRRQCRQSNAGTPYVLGDRSALEVSGEERRRVYEAAWARGGGRFLGSFNDIFVDWAANETAANFVRDKIREIVADPSVAEALMPTSYPIGTKRIPMDSGYYQTFNRENVTLVDIRKTPIVRFCDNGIRTSEDEIPLDVIVFATGFDAITGSLLKLNPVGRNGVSLREKWANGPVTYLGIATAGFPNLFMITGPGSPSVLTNMPVAIEQHVDWTADCIQRLERSGEQTIETTGEAEAAWTDHVAKVAAQTLYPLASSWYVGANIEGKPRMFMPYVGGLGRFREMCDAIAADDYRGFRIGDREAVTEVDFDSLTSSNEAGVPEA